MFAVKGWNVDASSLKAQTKPFEQKNDDPSTKTTSRKRKRNASKNQDGSNTPSDSSVVSVTKDIRLDQQRPDKHSKRKHDEVSNGLPKSLKHDQISEGKKPRTDANEKQKKHSRSEATELEAKPQHSGTNDQVIPTKSKTSKIPGHDKAPGKKQRASGDHGELAKKDSPISSGPPVVSTAKLTPMQAAMRQKLISARFRHLNETLYTAPSQQAQDLFNANPNMFEEYHAGFRQQVAVWPENPVDKMLQKLRERGSLRLQNQKKAFKGKPLGSDQADTTTSSAINDALPRTQGICTVADCGCGDARLAQTLKASNDLQRLKLKILSYDLHSPSPHVTKADIAALPVADGSVDVVIFCLALMGTNWLSFIEEAYRILRWKGELWIAEIKSRFGRVEKKGRVVEHSVGNKKKRAAITKTNVQQQKSRDEAAQEEALAIEVDGVENVKSESDVQDFLKALERRGFVVKEGGHSVDMSNKMFVSMELIKAATPSKGKGADDKKSGPHMKKPVAEVSSEDEARTLKPCLYKLR